MVFLFNTAGTNSFILHERFARNPQKMDAPEKVLSQAHGKARPVADFLHENGDHHIILLTHSCKNMLNIQNILLCCNLVMPPR